MSEYLNLLALVAPVFLIIAIGMALRWKAILVPEAEQAIVSLVVKILYPCLILKSMIEADSFRGTPDVFFAPLAGFVTIAVGFVIARLAGRAMGFERGQGLRTFTVAVGILNYGYLPIPLVLSMFSPNELAVLFMHNVGVEFAVWTVGIAMLAGASLKQGLKRIGNPMVYALIVGLALNLTGGAARLPTMATEVISALAACAIPLGLLAIGGNLYEYTDAKEPIWNARDCLGAVVLRLGVLPLVGLLMVWLAPLSIELKRVLAIQAAMPSGIMTIVLAKHFGGHPIVAVRVVFATTLVGIVTMPLWLQYGLSLVGD